MSDSAATRCPFCGITKGRPHRDGCNTIPVATAAQPYDSPASATAAREEVGTMEEELIEALRAIIAIPSERTLLLNAEARAMYEIAKRTLERVESRG